MLKEKGKGMKSKFIYTYLIPFFILVYTSVFLFQYNILKTNEEVFPFFSWSLFSYAPLGDAKYVFIEINTIDSKTIEDKIVASHNHRASSNVGKAIIKAIKHCDRKTKVCSDEAATIVSPYLKHVEYQTLTATIIFCKIEMYAARERLLKEDKYLPRYEGREDCTMAEEAGHFSIHKGGF